MRKTTDLFLIDGQPMLIPDANLEILIGDIEDSDSAWDESGFLHRFAMRHGVGKWKFSYARLTGEEYTYMEQLFADKQTFRFTYPDYTRGGQMKEVIAYRKEHEIMWQSARGGQFRNYVFYIVGC